MESGYAAFLVGGCVRDAILGRPVHDWDIATSATPATIAGIFHKTFLTGEKYGSVTVLIGNNSVEVTTFRAEGGYLDNRHPENVEFVSNLDDDLSRRDFTMNAMAVSAMRELIDPFGGLEDIENRVVRCVGNPEIRFAEDALRMFRAYRFSAELGFSIEPITMKAIYANANKAGNISAERIRVELEKTLLSQSPEKTREMITAGLLDKYLASPEKSPDGLRRITILPDERKLRWCAFCAALHNAQSITSASGFLHDMRLDRQTIKACLRALSIIEFPENRIEIKRLLAKYGIDAIRCAAAANETTMREGNSTLHLARVDEIIESGECFLLKDLAISGHDLITNGHPAGSKLGETLEMLLDHVIRNPRDNTREILLNKW